MESELGVKKVLLTTSCTAALEMAALLIDAQPGDEIILPSFTFTSTANAFVLRGAKPVFVDIRPDTLNIDESQMERHCTERTKAVVAVHYAGVGCELDAIVDLARDRSIALIEDNAHGLFGKYRGRHLGTFGCMATQSFHETKNFTCGEGGALLINDERFIGRAEMIREKGTNRARFFRGEVDKYTWVDFGSSYAPSDILAAYLLAQLEENPEAPRTHLEFLYRAFARLGGVLRSAIAGGAGSHRPGVSYVLFADENRPRPRPADGAFAPSRNAKRVSLSAASSFEDGPIVRRQGG